MTLAGLDTDAPAPAPGPGHADLRTRFAIALVGGPATNRFAAAPRLHSETLARDVYDLADRLALEDAKRRAADEPAGTAKLRDRVIHHARESVRDDLVTVGLIEAVRALDAAVSS